MSSQSKDSGRGVNRREVMAAAGAALVLTPLAAFVRSALGGEPAARHEAELDDWSIDDMWTGYPRHAEPIGYARPRLEPEVARAVDPLDAPFLA